MSTSLQQQNEHEIEYPVSKYLLIAFAEQKGFEPTFIKGSSKPEEDKDGFLVLSKGKLDIRIPRSVILDRPTVETTLSSVGLDINDFEGYYLHLKALNLVEKISAPIEPPKEFLDIKYRPFE